MFKAVLGLFIWAGVLFAGHPEQPPLPPPPHFEEQVMPNPPPPRKDLMNPFSPVTQMKLQRGERILSTLVFDPQSYQLILSDRTSFGGEAVPPGVFSPRPTMILYQGALAPNRSDEEIAFMMAHELGHLNLHHMEKMDESMRPVMEGPVVGMSGVTFVIFKQKLQEREADMFGLYLYKKSGYSISFFPYTLRILSINPNIHYGSSKIFAKECSSLSMKDPHFSMKERFHLLVSESQRF